MRERSLAITVTGLAVAGAMALGCTSSSGTTLPGQGGHGANSGGGQGGTGGSVLFGGGGSGGGTGGGGGAVESAVYADTDTDLYKLDPYTFQLTTLGAFDCIGSGPGQSSSMTDIAVNAQGELWAVSAASIYRIEVQTPVAHCAQEIPLQNPSGVRFYALTFAPVGVLDPAKEMLVAGNSAGELWSIDDGGNLALHGNFGNVPADDGNGNSYNAQNVGKPWELSGDIVFLANGDSPIGFATVRDCPNPPSTSGCSSTDTLIQIDMAALQNATNTSVTLAVRGQIVQASGCSNPGAGNFGRMYGIAAWNDKIYGFSHAGMGTIGEISNADGTACLVQNYADNLWAGAAVTTLAPVIPPPPK